MCEPNGGELPTLPGQTVPSFPPAELAGGVLPRGQAAVRRLGQRSTHCRALWQTKRAPTSRPPAGSETARPGCPYRGPCGPVGLQDVVELPCRYPPIEKKIGLRYGTSQITHTATLNLWKLVIQRSSLLTKTTVAQIACTNIRMMASRPVRP